jgi:hypothetical protein
MHKTTYILGYALGAAAIAVADQPIEAHWLVLWSALVSLLGGIAAAVRKSRDWFVLLQYGINTMAMGISLTLLSYFRLENTRINNLATIGACGVLALGGLAMVDYITSLARRITSSHAPEPEKPVRKPSARKDK